MGTVIRRPGRALGAGLVLGLLAVLVAGCDLFKPATPEAGGGGAVLIPNYSTPESCLTYMELGIERRDNAGLDAYLGALGDTTNTTADLVAGFHAFFDPADWNAYTGNKPADWDRDREEQFLAGFVRLKTAPYQMTWAADTSNPHDDPPEVSPRTLHRRYEVRAMQSPPVTIAVGYADLYFTRISGSRWALTRWQDRVDPRVGAHPADDDQQTFGRRRLNAGVG